MCKFGKNYIDSNVLERILWEVIQVKRNLKEVAVHP